MKYTKTLTKPLRNIPPGRPHITVTTTLPMTMIDLGTYEVPFNADHIHRAADDPYHSLDVKLMHHVFGLKRRLLKALTKAPTCAYDKNRGAYDAWPAEIFSNALRRKGM